MLKSSEINHYNNSVTNIDDYLKLFEPANEGQLKGETSNTYMYHDKAAERIKHYNPEMKMLAVLRQPAERLYSRYLHLAREDRLPTPNFEDCLDKETIWWERNDLFFVFYAVISMSFFYSQVELGFIYGFAVGFGIMAYGLTYFIVHDIFIHQRFKILRNASNWYAKGIRKAHKMHHANLKKDGGESFGMLFPPIKYFKEK